MALTTLKTRADFQRVRGGQRWSTPSFLLEARLRPEAARSGTPRFGFTITKKIGSAVVRNRVRRRLRALVASLDPAQVKDGCDYVLVVRPAAVGRAFRDLRADLEQALARVNRPQAHARRGQKTV